METINTVATAAAKAVWGDNEANKEPVSGASGDVSKGEPYDAGNMDESEQKKYSADTDPAPEPTPEPQADAKPAPADTTAKQNDTRKPEDTGADAEQPADNLTGPGPKPLEVVAREHGGDAGNEAEAAVKDDKKEEGASEEASKAEGTGEQWVKTSGLAADGGDFDATKPGAGREADRLMETKGIHVDKKTAGGDGDEASKTPSKDSGKASSASPSDSKKDKPSLGDRIKAKLHKN